MATLAGKKIKDTYKDLLQISNSNSGIDSSLKTVSDGEGTDSLLQLSSSAVNISSAGALHYAGTPITATGSELNLLDGVTATTAEINYIDGVTSNIQTQLNSKLSSHPNISAASSSNNSGAVFIQDITLDSNGHITGLGTATASTLTTEAVEDIVGAMFTSNTDTRIATSYDDNNAKIDLAVNDMTIGNQVEAVQDIIGAMVDGGTETRIAVTYDDANAKFNFIVDDMTADTNTQLSNAQVRTAVEAATDSNVFTNADHSKLNAIEAGATADQTDEEIQDIVGAMFTSTNTETGITATYQDATGDIDLVVGTLNQDTTGNADTATKIASITNSNIVQLTDTQTLTNKTLASPTFTGDINFTDASTPILTITDTTNTAQLRLFATDTTTDIGSLSAHKVNFRYNNDIRLQLEDTKFMVNAGSDDMDFTVKDASGLQALHVDAGDGDVNIRTLDVSGDADIDGTLETDALTIGGVTSVPFEAADHSKLDGIAASANNYVLPLKDEDNMASNSSTHVSSQQSIKAYVDAEVAGVVDSSPAALNTLNELAAALGDDANFSTTTSTSLGNRLRVDTASQGLTGTQQANAITNLGITATKAELNILDGVTATATELNIMDGVTATTAELNYTDGVTSNIQTQLDATLDTAGTGIDISSTTVSVDVSDFMANGVNNYVLTATGTDAFRGEGNLTFDGSTLAVTGAITGSSTLNVTGVTTLQNHLELGDSDKIKLGDSQDLEIYHDGTNSVINNTQTGALQIYNNVDNGMIELLTDNGSGGTQVFLRADGANNMVRMPVDGVKFTLGDASDLQLYHDGSNNYLRNNTTDQDFSILVNDGGSTITAMKIDASEIGRIKLPNDDQQLTIGAGQDLRFYHTSDTSNIVNFTGGLNIQNAGAGSTIIKNTSENQDIFLQVNDGGSTINAIRIDASDNARVKLANDNQKLSIGASNDIEIFHDGTDSTILNQTGDLIIKNNADDAGIRLQCDDGSGGTTNYITLDGEYTSINLSQNTTLSATKKLYFDGGGDTYIQEDSADSLKIFVGGQNVIRFYETSNVGYAYVPDGGFVGAGNSIDLTLSHDGSNSQLVNNTGDLYIRNNTDDGDIHFQVDDSSTQITAIQIDGSDVGRVILPNDNQKLTIGAGYDLNLYNNGSVSYISNSNNYLTIDQNAAAGMQLRNLSSDQDITFSVNDGGSQATALQIDASNYGSLVLPLDNQNFYMGASNDFRIVHNGTDTYVQNYTGDFYIRNNTDDKDIILQCDDGSGGVTAYLTLDGSAGTVNIDKEIHLSTHLDMGDGDRIKLGDSDDLQFVHDSNINFIHSTISDRDIYFRVNDGDSSVDAIIIDASEVGRVKLPNDNQYLSIGASGDLYFFHDGTNSVIRNATGDLVLRNDEADQDIILQTDDGSGGIATYITLDGSAGTVNIAKSTSFAASTNYPDSIGATFGDSGDLQIFHNGSYGNITNGTGNLYIDNTTDDGDMYFRVDDAGTLFTAMRIDGSEIGNVHLPNDGQSLYIGANNDIRLVHLSGTNYMYKIGRAHV